MAITVKIIRITILLTVLMLPFDLFAQPLLGKVGVYSLPNTPWWNQWTSYKEILSNNPDFNLEWYLRGELGSEQQLITGARRNRIQIISVSSQGMASIAPELSIVLAPNVFSSLHEADFIFDNYLSSPIRNIFRSLGLEILHYTEVGWGVLYTTNQPVVEPHQLKNKTLRISPSLTLQSFMQALKTDYAILEIGELIPALQTGLVQGGLTNLIFAHNALGDQICCVTELRLMYEMGANFANAKWYRTATEAQKLDLINSYQSLKKMRENVRQYNKTITDGFGNTNLAYFKLSKTQRQSWEKASSRSQKLILENTGFAGQELFDILNDGKEAYRQYLHHK